MKKTKKQNKHIIKKGGWNETIQDCDNPYEIVRKAVEAQEDSERETNLEKCLRSGEKLFTH